MTETEIKTLIENQRNFFHTGDTFPVKKRIEKLRKLKTAVLQHETEINEALKKLSTKHREVVVLHDVKGLNHTEISALLGISEGTLRSRLHYAHKELQGLLAEYLS